ncbi:MAG: DMT family transporter [Thainema sp.]
MTFASVFSRGIKLRSFQVNPIGVGYRAVVETLQSWSAGGAILTLIAALLGLSCASIFIVIAEQDLNPSTIVLNRLLIAAIAFSCWSKLLPQPALDRDRALTASESEAAPVSQSILNIAILALAGISLAASQVCSSWSLTQTSVANSALLNNLMPIFTTLGAWLVLGRCFRLRFVIGLMVATAGVIAIGLNDLHVDAAQMAGDAAALLAAVLLAVFLLSIEHLRQQLPTTLIMTNTGLIGCAILVPVMLWHGDSLWPTSWNAGFAVLALALISQVMGHGLLTHSLKTLSSSLVSVSMLSIPAIAAVLAMILFGQPLTLANGLAFCVVLAGIYLAISAQNQPAAEISDEFS